MHCNLLTLTLKIVYVQLLNTVNKSLFHIETVKNDLTIQ